MSEKIGDRVKGHCPSCGPDRWAIIKGTYDRRVDEAELWVVTTHRILQCPACEEVYHQTDHVFSEDMVHTENPFTGDIEWDYEHSIKHWPAPSKRERPSWVDRLAKIDFEIYKLLDEVYSALESGLDVLAAIGIRTTFDRGSELLGIDPAKTFAEKLSDLFAQGFIGSTEKDSLTLLTEAGNASAHRGWRPSPQQLETLIQLIESFVHRNFILRGDVSVLQNAIPAKPRRKPKTN